MMYQLPHRLYGNLQKFVYPNLRLHQRRFMSNITGQKLIYNEHGDPIKVVHIENETIKDPQPDQLVVKMLASPVNPADINTIQGKYPVRPPLPAVAGNEGVGEIVSLGSGITDLNVGDRVVPLKNALGTWCTHLVLTKNDILKVPKDLGLVEAATLIVNPCTAYRMLRDFVTLKPGDTIIQNGGNSAVGQNVIQICRTWGIRTVNIVRDRCDVDELKEFLMKLGATYVLTEEELRKTQIFKEKKLEKPKLALNCVGGQNALEISRHLQNEGVMVTYGGMSREPVTIPTSALIFKNLSFRGFWMTQWSEKNADNVDRFEMFEEIICMMMNNELQTPAYKMVKFVNFKEALMNTMTVKGMIGKKYLLEFESL